MRQKKSDNKKNTSRPSKPTEHRNPQFETPSQKRNRDGVGRIHVGSDGGSNKGRGSNH
jgi:hypothetical protein